MSLNQTPGGERVHIGFFGCRNAGKSSLLNAVTNQDLAVVSETKGTTTDPVSKAMELLPYVKGADALSIESTYLEEEAEMAKQYSHLTAKMAAELAREAEVGKLYLTHISRRYREKDILAEAQEIFPNTEIARDLSQFQIRHAE